MADIHVYTKSKASQCGRGQPTFMIFYHKSRMIIHFKALIYCQPNIVQTCAKEKKCIIPLENLCESRKELYMI